MSILRYIHDLFTQEKGTYTKTKDFKKYEVYHTDGTKTTIPANGWYTDGRGLRTYYAYKEEPRRVRSSGKPVLRRASVATVGDIQLATQEVVGEDTWTVERWDHGREQEVTADLVGPRDVSE